MKVLVTGGGGFLGSAIVRMLCQRGEQVTVLGRQRYPHIESLGASSYQADVRDAKAVLTACSGIDAVIHTAALAGIWGPRDAFWGINVDGTRHVIEGCRAHGVRYLVYTSSPSVVFGGDELCGVDESVPYPKRFLAAYPETKAVAEQMVLAAHSGEFQTVALRPHLIWGPGDPHLLPRVVERARRGQLRQVGSGENLVDITFVDNAARAHLLALDELRNCSRCGGKPYFISQGEPVKLWPWLNRVLERVGAPRVRRTLSHHAAYRAGVILEFAYRVLGRRHEPRMTRFLADQLAKSHYFDISAARRDFGYEATIDIETGLELWVRSLRS